MEVIAEFLSRFASQLQSPTLAFLLGGIIIMALGSKLSIPDSVYQFIVFVLLMRIGIKGGIEIRNADLSAMILPALSSVAIGLLVVLGGRLFFKFFPKIKTEDGIATAGLFGAVSASTLAAALIFLDELSIGYEAWVPALYPFMDIPALILAIVLADVHKKKQKRAVASPIGVQVKEAFRGDSTKMLAAHGRVKIWPIVKDSLRGPALSALLLGLVLGLVSQPESVLKSFYDPMFRGFLSILMLVLGMEAYGRLAELRKVAHWFGVYGFIAPLVHGFMGFGFGYLAHLATGFSPGGVILLAVIASSNSDISGPPTLRAGIPQANPSAYIGASTAIGTPVALALGIPLFVSLGQLVFNL